MSFPIIALHRKAQDNFAAFAKAGKVVEKCAHIIMLREAMVRSQGHTVNTASSIHYNNSANNTPSSAQTKNSANLVDPTVVQAIAGAHSMMMCNINSSHIKSVEEFTHQQVWRELYVRQNQQKVKDLMIECTKELQGEKKTAMLGIMQTIVGIQHMSRAEIAAYYATG